MIAVTTESKRRHLTYREKFVANLIAAMRTFDGSGYNWHIDIPPHIAKQFLREENQKYNRYDSNKIADMLEQIEQAIPKLHGETAHKFVFGHESSRVIYLSVPRYILSSEATVKLFAAIGKAIEVGTPDEHGLAASPYDDFRYRFWWD